ncbi:MAG: aminodeoxychorismate lyase [Gammaproteobacteria bacterium]
MILVNGEYRDHIAIADRGFQYGDGLFETIEVRCGKPLFLIRHLQRLELGCRRLLIPFPPADLLRLEATSICKDSERAVLKLIVTRGSGGRGYRPPEPSHPTRVLQLHPFPDYPDTVWQQGITARFCRTRLGLNPATAGMKHLNRLEQVLARAEWKDPGIQEGIMLDLNGHVIEGTMTNLFYFNNGAAYTPSLTLSGVDGIARRLLMTLLTRQGHAPYEAMCTPNELLAADEVFVCNSVIGLWPVKMIENTLLPVGPFTRKCQIELEKLKNEALGDEY